MVKLFNYSVDSNQKINKHINNDLNLIKKEILKEINDIKCILLGGGFGRGEGSVLMLKNLIQPINDYDIYVICNIIPDENKRTLIRKRLNSIIKIRQIDIDYRTRKDLKNSKKTVSDFDLKYASKLIYGDISVLNTMPEFNSNEIKLSEGIIPLNLYLIALIQSFPYKNNIKDEFWGKQQICKSILGWSMALLINEKKYDPSYFKRKIIFNSITNDQEMIDLVNFATEFKLKPRLKSKDNWDTLWHRNLYIHLKVINIIYSKYYKKNIDNIFDVIDCIKNNFWNKLKKFYGLVTGRKSYIERENLIIIELLILSYINESKKGNSLILSKIEIELKKRLSIKKINKRKVLNYCIEKDINCAVWKKRGNKIFY